MAQYSNAKDILPGHLLQEVQRHVQGALLYIPSADDRRPWGSLTGARCDLEERNTAIKQEYRRGASLDTLAGEFHLSFDTVRKIVRSH